MSPVEFEAIRKEAEISRHLRAVFPKIHAHLAHELEQAHEGSTLVLDAKERCDECGCYYGAHALACTQLDRSDPIAMANAEAIEAYDEASHGGAL